MSRFPAMGRVLSCVVALGCAAPSALLWAAAPATPFTSGAVLQRDVPVPVWGTGEPGEQVTVRFAGQEKSATTDDTGRWAVTLEAMPMSAEGRSLEVVGQKSGSTTSQEVLVGEVWLCSGQSNMEWKVGRAMNAAEEIKQADFPLLRQMDVPNVNSGLPLSTVQSSWQVCSPQTAGSFTAVGYFFAREIHQRIGVPVGLIAAEWGGTAIEPWIAPEGFRAVPELTDFAHQLDAWSVDTPAGAAAWNQYFEQLQRWQTQARQAVASKNYPPPPPNYPQQPTGGRQPCRLYNGMIRPLVPLAMRGVIWYQGESNGDEGVTYLHKKQALVRGWRTVFAQPDLAFYWVQLANFKQSDPETPWVGDGWARLREAQLHALTLPHTGMAVIIDIGQANDIHPPNKQDVGKRLSLWALAQDYGQTLVKSGPLYRSHTVEASTIRVAFDFADSGLMVGLKQGLEPVKEVADASLSWFAIAGEDQVWKKATAVIDGNTVVVSSPDVPRPVAVRYGFAMNPQGCNLYNKAGLPASPFRTDKW